MSLTLSLSLGLNRQTSSLADFLFLFRSMSALAIYHSSRVSIGKVEARMIAHSVFLSYCIALVNLLGRSLDE